MYLKSCVICKKVFISRRADARYCSRECLGKRNHTKSGGRKQRRQNVACPVCNKPFVRYSPNRRYCSAECRREARQQQRLMETYAATMPDEPTQFLPGTIEKLIVMQRRVAAGQSPFHPDDARLVAVDDNEYVSLAGSDLLQELSVPRSELALVSCWTVTRRSKYSEN